MPLITIYTRETCAPCKTVKWYLKQRGYEFEEKDIDEPDNLNEFTALGQFQMVPLTVIGDATVQGLNLSSIGKQLDYWDAKRLATTA